MEHLNQETTATEAAASQNYKSELSYAMSALKVTIQEQLGAYERLRKSAAEKGLFFEPVQYPKQEQNIKAALNDWILRWGDNNRYEFDDMIEEACSATLEYDMDWQEQSCTIEIKKNVDGREVIPNVIQSLVDDIENWEGWDNG